MKMTVEYYGVSITRELYVIDVNGVLSGEIGDVWFKWDRSRYDLPMLKLTSSLSDKKRLYVARSVARLLIEEYLQHVSSLPVVESASAFSEHIENMEVI